MITRDVTYISEFPAELWRAGSENDPDFHRLRLPPRPAGASVDLIPFPHPQTGELWVKALGGGASTFDGPHPAFKRGWWWIVPKGTGIPVAGDHEAVAQRESGRHPLHGHARPGHAAQGLPEAPGLAQVRRPPGLRHRFALRTNPMDVRDSYVPAIIYALRDRLEVLRTKLDDSGIPDDEVGQVESDFAHVEGILDEVERDYRKLMGFGKDVVI
jgi:hypothetical protein